MLPKTKNYMGSVTKNNGKDKLPWKPDIWERASQAVHEERQRTSVARRFLPIYGPLNSGATTIASDTVVVEGGQLSVDEVATTSLVELFLQFFLTPAQVEREEELTTFITLATRAANLLSQAEDIVIFQGQSAIDGNGGPQHALFAERIVRARSGPAGRGLVNAASGDPVTVPALDPNQTPPHWGENTAAAFFDAYARLQSGQGSGLAEYGPYAGVLSTAPYADAHAPLATTLSTPSALIKPLVEEGFYGTGTLPASRGLLLSLGGDTMDLVVGVDATIAFLQEDAAGNYVFRLYERIALRIKSDSAIVGLEFEGA
jgi:uncharacterized linocin/CFP29 family protein